MDAYSSALSNPQRDAEAETWQQAAERVDALLRAYRAKSHEQRAKILIKVLSKARELHHIGSTHPVELSVGILSGALKHKLCAALNEKDFSRARLELWVADAITEIPELLASGVRRANMKAPPKIASGPRAGTGCHATTPHRVGNICRPCRQNVPFMGKRPLLRSLLLYSTGLGLMFALFWLTR